MSARTLTALVSLSLAATAVSQSWIELQPPARPTGRTGHAMVWDSARSRAVLFGGYDYARDRHLQDHWELDGTSWSRRTLARVPPARQRAGMCYDERRGVVVLFGGAVSPAFGATRYLQDTWEFDGTSWREVSPAGSLPSPRAGALAYDSRRDVTVLFGGDGSASPYVHDDTWEFDGVSWTRRNTPAAPPARSDYALAFDARRGRLVAQPGYTMGQSTVMETWEFDGNLWAPVTTAATLPPFVRPAMTYDPLRGVVVLVGSTYSAPQETWEFDGAIWRALPATADNVGISGHALVHDSGRGAVLMFGGSEERRARIVDSDETWQLGTLASHRRFGAGCAVSGPAPALDAASGSLPHSGAVFVTEVRQLQSLDLPILLLGFDTESWGGVRLPFDLRAIGLGGCDLLTSSDVALTLQNLGGAARWSVTIPADPRLHGETFYGQSLVFDARMQPRGVSNGSAATIGL